MSLDGLVFLGLLVVLAVLAIPVGVIVLFVRMAELRDRVGRLERDLAVVRRDAPQGTIAPVAATLSDPPAMAETGVTEDFGVPPPKTEALATSPDPQVADPDPAPPTEMPPLPPPSPSQDKPIVFRPDRVAALSAWVKVNWIYLVSAASLALAGIFFVQYGMERGLLPPGLRVLTAIGFGMALIAGGEWVRRRHGDEGDTTTRHLPSVFSGAGLVSIFGATIAARHLYGLIGPEMAFAGHVATAVLALVLGWFHGPLLIAVGLIGAAVAPFIVAGGSAAAPWLYGYFGVVTALGLGVDAIRRWAWVSVLALVLGYGGSFLSFAGGAGASGWAATMIVLALMAVAIPVLSLWPRHDGPSTLQTALQQSGGVWPVFPVRLAQGGALVSSVGLLLTEGTADVPLLVPVALAALALACLLWAEKAPGLTDLSLPPAVCFVAWVALQGAQHGDVFRAFVAQAIALRPPETAAPLTVTLLVALALAISVAAGLRAMRREGPVAEALFGLMAVLVAPLTIGALELLWVPAPVIGTAVWSAHVLAMAGLATLLATRFAAVDAPLMRRAAHAVLAALSLIALALFLLTTATALTLALAVLLVVAAGLDRRFDLPEMGLFQQVGVAVISYRLLIDPGLDFALDGPVGAVILAFAGSIGALVAARWMIGGRSRAMTAAVLESAGASLAAVFANVLLTRWLIPEVQSGNVPSFWQATLTALPWLVLMLAQLYRAEAGPTLRRVRLALAGVAGVLAAGAMLVAVLPMNPLLSEYREDAARLVSGPPLIDTLFMAYAVPGLMLLLARGRLPGLAPLLRLGFLVIGAGLVALYAALEIRRWWQGDWLGLSGGVSQAELYTYTLALMLLGAALLFRAIQLRSDTRRRLAMAVILLVVAKVFLIDAAGLTGLTRVFSFLGLGLSLAGLAWLNRWVGKASARPQ